MVFTAKWHLVSTENAEAFYKHIHTRPEFLERLRIIHAELATNPDAYVEELTVDKAAGKVHRVVFIRGEKKRDSGLVNLNEEFEHEIADGRRVKCRAVLEGDDKLIFHEKGDDFEATVTLVLHGDEITATLRSGDVVSTEKLRRVHH